MTCLKLQKRTLTLTNLEEKVSNVISKQVNKTTEFELRSVQLDNESLLKVLILTIFFKTKHEVLSQMQQQIDLK